jgi:hypothetical protein
MSVARTMRHMSTAKTAPLSVDLVPRAFWGSSLANKLPRGQWERCRAWALAQAGNRCTVCAVEDHLECDEVWRYEHRDAGHVRILAGIRAVCHDCHAAKHFGLALQQGRRAANRAALQLMRRNGWSRARVKQHIDEAFRIWDERNAYVWIGTDLSWLAETLGLTPHCRASACCGLTLSVGRCAGSSRRPPKVLMLRFEVDWTRRGWRGTKKCAAAVESVRLVQTRG